MKYKWIGTNTQKNIRWEYMTDSLKELYDTLQQEQVINFYDCYEPIVQDYAYENDIDLDDIDDEDEFNRIYEAAFNIEDEDYKDYIEREQGNAYYQWFYEWDDEKGWVEF